MSHTFRRPLLGSAALAIALLSGTAQAHQVWLEPQGQGAKLYFGEFGENLREASPGLLDKFVKPLATKVSAAGARQDADTSKTPNGFAFALRAGKGEALIAEEPAYPISERKDAEGKTTRSAYIPAARLAGDWSAAQQPSLTLDLVPTGKADKDGVELQAFFKGQPLPKGKVAVVTQSGWMQEHHTDEQGKLKVALPWKGTYVLELQYQEKAPGTRANGDAYDRATYVTSLTLLQPKGLAPLAAPPAAKPNELK
jgi:uncharacterized GH25 family protein